MNWDREWDEIPTSSSLPFFFDKQTVEIDRQATYTVADPHDRILYEPLVALFRARTSNSESAFTFKLVNVHLDPVNASEELSTLHDVYSVVLSDVDQEDDVLLLGNFSADTNRLSDWGHSLGIQPTLPTQYCRIGGGSIHRQPLLTQTRNARI